MSPCRKMQVPFTTLARLALVATQRHKTRQQHDRSDHTPVVVQSDLLTKSDTIMPCKQIPRRPSCTTQSHIQEQMRPSSSSDCAACSTELADGYAAFHPAKHPRLAVTAACDITAVHASWRLSNTQTLSRMHCRRQRAQVTRRSRASGTVTRQHTKGCTPSARTQTTLSNRTQSVWAITTSAGTGRCAQASRQVRLNVPRLCLHFD